MKTVVLDDDPTGTQSASGVSVLLDFDVDSLTDTLRDADSVYVQTNSRAIDREQAVELVGRVRSAAQAASERLDVPLQFVLRGDSTLRGHVFPETDVFMDDDSVILFVPAFPAGGRTTRGGVHYVRTDGVDVPAHETEYALDPVFGFSTGVLADYVREKSGRAGLPVDIDVVRAGGLADHLVAAAAGTVVLPDAVTDDDIRLIADATVEARRRGTTVVVRSAAPLAAALAKVQSDGLLAQPLRAERGSTLVVCGSHTAGASRQLEMLRDRFGAPAVIDTALALDDPQRAGHEVARAAAAQLDERGLALIASGRDRSAEHNTLAHGEAVMTALTTAVRELEPRVDVVVAKGGITSADVARVGLGAHAAEVLGQVLPGVSVWKLLRADAEPLLYVVVPGNVGEPDTIVKVLDALGW